MGDSKNEKFIDRCLSYCFKRCPKSGRIRGLNFNNNLVRFCFPLTGFLALIWFLIRVVPKPSRAAYPCMRVAAPVASGFVTWIIGIGASVFALRKARRNFGRARFITGMVCAFAAVIAVIVTISFHATDALAGRTGFPDRYHTPNQPMGTGVGINPGRVVWVHDANATNENCTNAYGDGYFLPMNNNQKVINKMLDDAVIKLAGTANSHDAWDAIFHYFNLNHQNGDVGYTPGELIFIKVNSVSSWYGNIDPTTFEIVNNSTYGNCETSPEMVLALLHELIDNYGVRQQDIIIGDPMRDLYKHCTDLWLGAYPYIKILGTSTANGHVQRVKTSGPRIFYADKGTCLHEGTNSDYTAGAPVTCDYLWTVFEDAKYLINVPAMKAHNRAGMSLTAKNHFGSQWQAADNATHMHGGLVNPDDNDVPKRPGMGKYRVLVDLMGNKYLGGKTVFYLVDGLWTGSEAVDPPRKFQTAPFNGDWTSSVFVSQDPVALESVCFDFLRTEFKHGNPYSDAPQMDGVDDHLEQAADPSKWPSGITYAPDGDGVPLTSLGVHEHWNNSIDKQYSRNLYPLNGAGIELVKEEGVSDAVFAVNCGGGLYTDNNGTVYAADKNVTGGTSATTTSAISGTTDQLLYQSERWGNSTYTITGLADGTYAIKFQFAETYWSAANKRVFDVVVGNQTVISKLDIYAQVGKNTAYDVTKNVTVSGGTLTISFTNATVDQPKICAFRISKITDTEIGPVANAGPDQTVSINTPVTLDGRGSYDPDNKPSALTYSWSCLSHNITMSGANTAQPTFTPSAAGIYTFELMVGDGALIAKDQVVITVIGSGISLPGRIEAENYKAGGENVGYHDLTSGNTGGAYNPNDNVDIEATSDIGGGYNVGWIDANEWLAYDVNIQSAGTYKFTARMASANAGTKTITITVDGNPLTTISSTTSSGWQAWTDAVSANVSLTSGNHVIRFSFSGGFNLNYVDVASVAPNPGALQFSAAAYSVNENGSSVSITVSRVNGSEGSVTVNYATTNGTATAGADYSTTNGTLTFAAGVTSQTFSVPIIDDQSVEGNETVNLTLSNPTGGATLGSPVSAVLTIADNDQSGIALPGRIQAEDYMSGGEGVGYHDLTSGNTGGDYKPSDNVDIEATTDMGGGYNVGWIDASEWLSYNVNVAATGAYSLTARLASGNAGTKTLTMTVDGTTVGTFNFTDASGWQSWNNIVVSNVNLTAGSHVVRLIATTGGFNLNYIDVATQGNIAPIAYAGPDFSAAKNTVVTLDGYNSTDPDNAPSPLTYAWSQVSGPTVSINAPVHARVTCTPTVAGIYVFRLTVSDGAATSYDDVTVTVSEETNLLANGDFTNGLTGWTSLFLENATGSITNDANSAKIAITALGPNPWDVQLFQSISLTANKTYTLEFDMKAAATPKSFKIVIEHDGGSYTKYHEQQYSVTSAANTYQHFVITFIPNATDTQVKLGFHLGTFNTSSVWIDNVVLK